MQQMRIRSKGILEQECLKAARFRTECRAIERITIRRLRPQGSGPNWEPAEFHPLPTRPAEMAARHAIVRLQGTYELAKE